MLRRQLLNARQQGLPEATIRRDFAWPLFQAAVDAGHLREAEVVLATELSGDFGAELPRPQLDDWWMTLGDFHLQRRALSDATECYDRARELNEAAGDQRGLAGTYRQLGRIAQEQRDLAGAARWFFKAVRRLAVARDPRHLQIAVRSFARTYPQTPAADRREIGQAWFDAGLPRDVIDQIDAPPDDPPRRRRLTHHPRKGSHIPVCSASSFAERDARSPEEPLVRRQHRTAHSRRAPRVALPQVCRVRADR